MIYELKDGRNIFHKVWNEIYLLLFFNIGLLLGNVSYFTKNYLIIELCVFILLIYRLFNKRNRHVFKIELNDEGKVLKVYYYQFIVLKFEQEIPYKALQLNYKHKQYGRGKVPKTLEFRQRNTFVVEIKQKYNLGWTNEELDNIYKTLNNKITE